MKIETKLKNLLENHDWWAFMSDDPSVDKRAQENWIEILQLMRDFPNREEAMRLYKKHCPGGLFGNKELPSDEDWFNHLLDQTIRKSIGL